MLSASPAITDLLIPLAAARRGQLVLAPFSAHLADTVASWAASPDELHWVAPSTQPPLTAEKVREWKRDEGHAYILCYEPNRAPVAYAELNPMRRDPTHFWLGHVLVCPQQRGRGIGLALVRKLIAVAFDELNSHRVSLVVFPENRAAIRCYAQAGMHCRGREQHQFNGRGPRFDLLRFEIGRAER